jgi:hypothetical protein
MMNASHTLQHTSGSRRGRNAIRRARPSADACRLRHAQVLLPRGLHRTRVSEMRAEGVRVPAHVAVRHPFRGVERVEPV